MLDIEKQKQNFKNHVATFTDYGNIKILDFKNPYSTDYRIRFIFEEDYYRLHISGNLGNLIATNYNNMCFDKFGDFVNSIGYFEEKIECHDRPLYYYDCEKARRDFVDFLKEYGTEQIGYFEYDDFIDEIVNNLDHEIGLSKESVDSIRDFVKEYISENYDYEAYVMAMNLGKERSNILELYMLAFHLPQSS